MQIKYTNGIGWGSNTVSYTHLVVLNFARDLLVDEEAILTAIEEGKVKKYVTDFPNTRCV